MDEHQNLSSKQFLFVTLLNVLITIVEFIGGVFSGSLSLISDGFHNLGDSFSIVLSYFASEISKKPQSKTNTFGYKRAQIIAAFLNSIFLVIICLGLIYEAVKRSFNPSPINGNLMLVVAIIGLLANFISAFILAKGTKNNLNIKSTYLHVLSDALSSIAIIVGGVLIKTFDWEFIDPLVTILVAVYIIYESIPIVKESLVILMQNAPKLDYDQIKMDLLKIKDVKSVHHIHAWLIDENNIVFSAHINLSDMPISQAEIIYNQITEILNKKYHIAHVTLQAEVNRGKDESIIYNRGKDIP